MPHRETRPLYALMLRLLAMLAVSVMFACVKWASERGVHVVESLFYRQLFGMPVALAGVMLGPGLGALKTRNLKGHISRSTIGTLGMVLNFSGYILLPLAEATTIGESDSQGTASCSINPSASAALRRPNWSYARKHSSRTSRPAKRR